MVTSFLDLIHPPHLPRRLWVIGQSPSRAAQDVASLLLRALLLFTPLACV